MTPTTSPAAAGHIVVRVDREGWKPYHYNPSNGQDWTEESAAAWVRRCMGAPARSGSGCGAAVELCYCTPTNPAAAGRTEA